jgi:hypothetical protein
MPRHLLPMGVSMYALWGFLTGLASLPTYRQEMRQCFQTRREVTSTAIAA